MFRLSKGKIRRRRRKEKNIFKRDKMNKKFCFKLIKLKQQQHTSSFLLSESCLEEFNKLFLLFSLFCDVDALFDVKFVVAF